MRELEHQAGAQLLRRTTRRLELTEPEALAVPARPAHPAGSGLGPGGDRQPGHHPARPRAPERADRSGRHVPGPAAAGFHRPASRHLLRVFFANRVVDLIAAEIDVALEVTLAAAAGRHVARDICAIDWQLCASPAYLARNGPPDAPADLARCQFLCPPYPARRFVLTLDRGEQREQVELIPHLQSEHFPFLMRAVRDGHGVGLLPVYAGWDDVREGRLVPVLDGLEAGGPGQPPLHHHHAQPASIDGHARADRLPAHADSSPGRIQQCIAPDTLLIPWSFRVAPAPRDAKRAPQRCEASRQGVPGRMGRLGIRRKERKRGTHV
ncbi:LysR family transcriptional regulator [Cupriavidus basilensis]